MPSVGDLDQKPMSERPANRELWAIYEPEALTGRIRGLTVRRQAVYLQAQAHRQGGHLVPASLCEELAENGSQLRYVLNRYSEATRPARVLAAALRGTTTD